MKSPKLSYDTGVYQLIYETFGEAKTRFVFYKLSIFESLQLIKNIVFL
jgi:hypothetical protein